MLSVIVRMPYRDGVLIRQTPSLVEVVRDHLGFPTWYVYSDGTMLRPIAGGAEGDDQGGSGGGQGGAGGDDRRFTQADMNATVARETAAAKSKAEADLAAALGCSVDEAKQIITDRKAADEAKKTEAERAAEAAKNAQTEAERLKGDAARELHEARVEAALAKAGLDLDNTVLVRAAAAAVDVAVGADKDAIKAAVDKAKADAPQLFGSTTTTTTTTDPGGQRRQEQQSGGEFGSRGAQEAARRWGKDKQTA